MAIVRFIVRFLAHFSGSATHDGNLLLLLLCVAINQYILVLKFIFSGFYLFIFCSANGWIIILKLYSSYKSNLLFRTKWFSFCFILFFFCFHFHFVYCVCIFSLCFLHSPTQASEANLYVLAILFDGAAFRTHADTVRCLSFPKLMEYIQNII